MSIQSAVAVEYTDCIFDECPGNDTEPSYDETSAFQFRGM